MPNSSGVLGTILAAGWSRRMGRSKALLRCPDGQPFVERITRSLHGGGVHQVAVVGRSDDEALQIAVAALRPVTQFVDNPHAQQGQLSSIQAAIARAEARRSDGLLVIPVDLPLVRAATVAAALEAFRTDRAAIVRVTHRGQHGHPVIFPARVFDDLRAASPSIGAKAVLRAHAATVLDVEVDDPGVLRDIDSPEDYRAVFGCDPP